MGGHPEAVQKVTAVYTAGASFGVSVGNTSTSTVNYSQHGGWGVASGGGPTTHYSERYTGLAALLTPPEEPVYRQPWGRWSILWIGFWAFGFYVLPQAAAKDRNGAAFAFVVDALFLAAMIGGVIWWKLRTASRRKRELGELHPRWERLMEQWDHSYYCHRDGIVFVPGEQGSIPAPEFPTEMALAEIA